MPCGGVDLRAAPELRLQVEAIRRMQRHAVAGLDARPPVVVNQREQPVGPESTLIRPDDPAAVPHRRHVAPVARLQPDAAAAAQTRRSPPIRGVPPHPVHVPCRVGRAVRLARGLGSGDAGCDSTSQGLPLRVAEPDDLQESVVHTLPSGGHHRDDAVGVRVVVDGPREPEGLGIHGID